ncbi:MAG: primosomal protein N' [Candidatus Omnitrophica bacterium]|nr:primosomal protein N' [Candidatus Omnitrophota bacterium]
MIAEVAFNLPLDKTFHYLIPPSMDAAAQPGARVAAPFGPRWLVGCIIARVGQSPIAHLKPIRRVIDPIPVIGDERWELARWLSRTYYCSLGEALAAMVPSQLRIRAPISSTDSGGPPEAAREPPKPLTPAQQQAWQTIAGALAERSAAGPRPPVVLLHGVTGSGKTELYLHAIASVIAQAQAAIYVIPEIALTPQTIARVQGRFGSQVAVWHSRLTSRQRAIAWQRLAAGRARIVIGARSAVFAPVPSLGLIIIDEEQETTYKQQDVPRYHTREVAVARARCVKAAVLLGSATPSLESFFAATQGRYRLATLPERIEGRPLPRVAVVDLREEMASRRRIGPFSRLLALALQGTVERGEQAMLLLNRRGFARTIQCQACGEVVRCSRCAIPVIYHASAGVLRCHYCNAHYPPPEACPACRKGSLRFRGSGTERVESELHRLFPMASIARMDRDTTAARDSHQRIFEAISQEHVGVVVGTQMIAKGHDFPSVTLVGVISADTSLNLPDFRAGERTFDLLTQMAGRAGRSSRPGQVVIQTYCPTHYAIHAASAHDYGQFYREELAMRRRLALPPFSRLAQLTVLASTRARAEETAERLAAALRQAAKRRRITMIGPAPHRVARLRRTYRMCVLLKGTTTDALTDVLRKVLQPGRKFGGLPVLVDVDPL